MRKDRAQCKIYSSKQKKSFNNFDTWPSGDNMSPLQKISHGVITNLQIPAWSVILSSLPTATPTVPTLACGTMRSQLSVQLTRPSDGPQVVEAFFLDPVSVSYVELEFHPCGAHLALLLHPEYDDMIISEMRIFGQDDEYLSSGCICCSHKLFLSSGEWTWSHIFPFSTKPLSTVFSNWVLGQASNTIN